MVVKSALASFPTLINEFGCSPGKTSAFLAASDRDSKGSIVVCVACIIDPSGKLTTLLNGPVITRFSSGQTKFEVAPESSTNVDVVLSKCLFLPVR